jgi:hypothetical protein
MLAALSLPHQSLPLPILDIPPDDSIEHNQFEGMKYGLEHNGKPKERIFFEIQSSYTESLCYINHC